MWGQPPEEEVTMGSTSVRYQAFQDTAILAFAYILVALFLSVGVFFLYEGLGIDFRILDYPGLRTYALPIGFFLLCLSLVTARVLIFESDLGGRKRQQATIGPVVEVKRQKFVQQFVRSDAVAANENHAANADLQNQAARSKSYLSQHTLDAYDATAVVGLRTVVHNGAIESVKEDGSVKIDLPSLEELRAAAAISRCLLPIRLLGREIRAIRKITGLEPLDILRRLGEEGSEEVLSQWESEDLIMDELTERKLRQLVCNEIGSRAPHVEQNISRITKFKIVDPWRRDQTYEVPPVTLNWVQIKEESGAVCRAWNDKWAA
jgi:hypothetical protein